MRFRKDHLVQVTGLRLRPDIVFPRMRLAVFIDGCFWHGCPEHYVAPKSNLAYWEPKMERNIERDKLANRNLRLAGWKVIRIWTHVPADEAVDLIVRALASACMSG